MTGPLDRLTLRVEMAAFGGLFLASPVILWELWRFITPGPAANEKRYAVPFVIASVVLFLAGCAIAYFIFPHALQFLTASGGRTSSELINPNNYLSLILPLMALFGLTFEFPVVLVALELAGVVQPGQAAAPLAVVGHRHHGGRRPSSPRARTPSPCWPWPCRSSSSTSWPSASGSCFGR